MSTGAKKAAQSRTDQSGGAQLVGNPAPVDVRKVPAFQGKSGQGDNQSTNRGAGRT